MAIFEKIGSFLAESTTTELVILAVLILVPLLALVLLIVSLARIGRERRQARRDAEASLVDLRAFEESLLTGRKTAELPLKEPKDCANERSVERVRVKVQVRRLNRVDKEMLVATGIFCVGLGFMIHQAVKGKNKRA